MANPILHKLEILGAWNETPRCRGFLLKAAKLASTNTIAGQCVQVAIGRGKPSYFALANPPGDECFEILVKRGTRVTDAIAAQPAGRALLVSAASGKGFDVEAHAGKNLLFVAVGSAVAPIRAALGVVVDRRALFGKVTVYLGQRESSDFAYASDLERFALQGVRVVRVLSGTDPSWTGPRGHVQHAILRDTLAAVVDRAAGAPLADTVAFVCGMESMVNDVTQALARLGLGAEHVLQNF